MNNMKKYITKQIYKWQKISKKYIKFVKPLDNKIGGVKSSL